MVLLMTVLESQATENCQRRFLQAGGLKVLQQWLHSAREGDNVDLMTFILRVTKQLPFNKDSVKESGIGKTIKKLTKYTNDTRDVSSLVELANDIVQSWKMELEKAKQQGAAQAAETKAPTTPLPKLVYQIDAKLAAGREAATRPAAGVAESKDSGVAPDAAKPTAKRAENGAVATAAGPDKAKLSVQKPEERKETVPKPAATPSSKTPEAKLVARLISGAKPQQPQRKTVPLDGPTAAAATEPAAARISTALSGSTLATQRQPSTTLKGTRHCSSFRHPKSTKHAHASTKSLWRPPKILPSIQNRRAKRQNTRRRQACRRSSASVRRWRDQTPNQARGKSSGRTKVARNLSR
jgi:hypothetical protein